VLFPTATPLLRAEFSGAALARALGAFGATLGGASAIGPLVGGVLTDTLGWRFIFFVNLPIGVASFAGGVARLRESRDPAGGRADWAGTALITGALTALMFALIRGNALGWASPAILALFATAAVAFAGFVIYELRIAAAPMADLRLFRRRSLTGSLWVPSPNAGRPRHPAHCSGEDSACARPARQHQARGRAAFARAAAAGHGRPARNAPRRSRRYGPVSRAVCWSAAVPAAGSGSRAIR